MNKHLELARDENTSSDDLESIFERCKDSPGVLNGDHWLIRQALASNPSSSSAIVEKLAFDSHYDIRAKIVKHEKISDETREYLLEELHQIREIEDKFKFYENLDTQAKKDLIERSVIIFNAKPYKPPYLPSTEYYDEELEHPLKRIFLALASKETNTEILQLLYEVNDFEIFLSELEEKIGVSISLALNGNTSNEIIERMIFRNDWKFLFEGLASRKNIPSSLLAILLFRLILQPEIDQEFRDYELVLTNPNLDLASCVACDDLVKSKYVRQFVASLQGIPEESLLILASDEEIEVRTAAFRNQNATNEVRAQAHLLGISQEEDEDRDE